jgi:hypothetical protein
VSVQAKRVWVLLLDAEDTCPFKKRENDTAEIIHCSAQKEIYIRMFAPVVSFWLREIDASA